MIDEDGSGLPCPSYHAVRPATPPAGPRVHSCMSEPPRRARWLPPLSAADGVLNRTTAATHIRVEADCAEQGCE